MLFLSVLCLLATSGYVLADCSGGCKEPTLFYEELGCKPVYASLSDCCPSKFDCSHITERAAAKEEKCYSNGKTYNVGYQINGDEMHGYCKFNCSCRRIPPERYGVKDIALKGDKVFISLTYSPKHVTPKRKFGDLSIKYMRTKLETDEELKICEKVTKLYSFNLEQDEELLKLEQGPSKKLCIEQPSHYDDDDDDDDDEHEEIVLLDSEDEGKKDMPRPLRPLKKEVYTKPFLLNYIYITM